MDTVAILGGLVAFILFGFILSIALARLALAIADLADRLGPKDPPDG